MITFQAILLINNSGPSDEAPTEILFGSEVVLWGSEVITFED